jgi:hypothetical protein
MRIPACNRLADFLARLGHSAENHALGGNARALRPEQLSPRHQVHPRAHGTQEVQNRQIAARLHAIANQMRNGPQRFFVSMVPAFDGATGIDIRGRADCFRDSGQRAILDIEFAIAVGELGFGNQRHGKSGLRHKKN